jgi:hypothetical protein
MTVLFQGGDFLLANNDMRGVNLTGCIRFISAKILYLT